MVARPSRRGVTMDHVTVLRADHAIVQEFDWGKLTWYASADLGNSGAMTAGRCELRPGFANPIHRHPNCEEILHVLFGKIAHAVPGGTEVELAPGDSVSIPAGVTHSARNVGDKTAVLLVCFSSSRRETIGE